MSHDTLIHTALRPAVRGLRRLGATPDQVTSARLATGLAAAAMLAAGPGRAMTIGAGLFLVSALLDRADGELARQSRRSSPHGRAFDLWSDAAVTVAGFLGLGWGLTGVLGASAPWLGLLAGSGAAASFLGVQAAGAPPALLATPGRRIVVDPDDALLLLPVLIWLGRAGPALMLAAVLAPLAAAALAWRGARGRQAACAPP